MAATQQTDHDPVTTSAIKTNVRHIHTSIASRHLATRGNNNILRTAPPHIISSEEILIRITRRTLAQLITNISTFLKSYLHEVYAKRHPSPLSPFVTDTHNTSSLHLHSHTHHIVTPGFVDRPRRSDCTAGQMDGEPGWWTTSGKIGLSPLAREWVDNNNNFPRRLLSISEANFGFSSS